MLTKPVLAIQSSAVWGLGSIAIAALQVGQPVRVVRPFRMEPLPRTVRGTSGVIVLAGSYRIDEPEHKHWQAGLRTLIDDCIRTRTPVLGICFGAQFLAHHLGGRVETLDRPQYGTVAPTWDSRFMGDPVFSHAAQSSGSLVAVWHQDSITQLPPDTSVLAWSSTSPQALRFTDTIWGAQYHPEVTELAVARWIRNDIRSVEANGYSTREILTNAQRLTRDPLTSAPVRSFFAMSKAARSGSAANP